jgi:hypothetical protein
MILAHQREPAEIQLTSGKGQKMKDKILESQKDSSRGIYGSGYLVPRAAMIEARNKAERNKAEQETNAIKWSLSPRELKIIETLEGADNGHNEKTNRKKE